MEEKKEPQSKEEVVEENQPEFTVQIAVYADQQIHFVGKTKDDKAPNPIAVRDVLQRVLTTVNDQIQGQMMIGYIKKLLDDKKIVKPGFRPSFFGKLRSP